MWWVSVRGGWTQPRTPMFKDFYTLNFIIKSDLLKPYLKGYPGLPLVNQIEI